MAEREPRLDGGIGYAAGQPAEQDVHHRHGNDPDPAGFVSERSGFVFRFCLVFSHGEIHAFFLLGSGTFFQSVIRTRTGGWQ